MFCPKCVRENPNINKFCNGCGASLKVALIPPPEIVSPAAQFVAAPPKNARFNQPKKNMTTPPVSQTLQFDTAKIPAKQEKSNGRQVKSGLTGNLTILIGAAGFTVLIGILGAAFFIFGGKTTTTKSETPSNSIVNQSKPTGDVLKDKTQQLPAKKVPDGMVYVAGGEFLLGSDTGDEYSSPAQKIVVEPFFIDLTEVTNEEYKKFLDLNGRKPPPDWKNNNFPDGKARFPVTGVNWDDANTYAKWAGKRLPMEEEWEFAAKGTNDWVYPWGNDWKPEFANADKQTTGMQEVGKAQGKSPFGLLDMSGNAWEWTASDARAYPNGKNFDANLVDPKVIRGGFWGSPKEKATTILRRPYGPRNEESYGNTGFRCVKNVSDK